MISIEEKIKRLKLFIKNVNKYSDEEIADQINLMLNQVLLSEDDLNYLLDSVVNRVPNNLSSFEKYEFVKKQIYEKLNYNCDYNSELWSGFESVLFTDMFPIFGDKFKNSQLSDIFNFLYQYKIDLENNKIKMTNTIISPYNSLEDIEDNVVVKKIDKIAKEFYQDTTKDFNERIKVFNKYGEDNGYIYHPDHFILKHIFQIWYEVYEPDKYVEYKCKNVIDWYIENLECNRLHISYSGNKYHPYLEETERGYLPSKEAIERLRKYYYTALINLGISKFSFDW